MTAITISYTKTGIIEWITAGDCTYRDCVDAGVDAECLADSIIDKFIAEYIDTFGVVGFQATATEDRCYSFGGKIDLLNKNGEMDEDAIFAWERSVGHAEYDGCEDDVSQLLLLIEKFNEDENE